MPPQLEQLLKQLWAISDEKNPFVFQSKHGPLDLDEISDVLHQAQDCARVKRFGLHGVRHFFASALHQAAASLAQGQEALGHATIDMTAKYTHVLESGREHVESVDRDFSCVVGLLAEGSINEVQKDGSR